MPAKNNNKNNKNIFLLLFGNTRGLVASCVQICTGEKPMHQKHFTGTILNPTRNEARYAKITKYTQ